MAVSTCQDFSTGNKKPHAAFTMEQSEVFDIGNYVLDPMPIANSDSVIIENPPLQRVFTASYIYFFMSWIHLISSSSLGLQVKAMPNPILSIDNTYLVDKSYCFRLAQTVSKLANFVCKYSLFFTIGFIKLFL